MAAIELDGVSKIYTRNLGRALLRQHILDWLGRKRTGGFYALRGVNLRIDHSESVAFIGHNGAGKSTLMAVVAGLCMPDEGRVAIDGRVAALLELGSGFNMDLTGAENVRLNASLLGISRERCRELHDRIVEFSGVGDFIDQPLRTYSNGMILRLAFSVAVNVDPDILILDEVFAVGDRNFQEKCRDKVMEFKRAGKTILCVSHSPQAVQYLCDRVVWLDHGEVIMDGPVDEVLARYTGQTASLPRSPLA